MKTHETTDFILCNSQDFSLQIHTFFKLKKYQGVKEFHMLARVGCCNIMVFRWFKFTLKPPYSITHGKL